MNMSQCFPEPYKRSGGNVKAELGLCHYVTKADMIGATGIDTSKLASKTDLDILKTKVKDLDVDKLKNVPANLSKLSTVVDNGIVKKVCMINWLPKSMLLMLRYQALVK